MQVNVVGVVVDDIRWGPRQTLEAGTDSVSIGSTSLVLWKRFLNSLGTKLYCDFLLIKVHNTLKGLKNGIWKVLWSNCEFCTFKASAYALTHSVFSSGQCFKTFWRKSRFLQTFFNFFWYLNMHNNINTINYF